MEWVMSLYGGIDSAIINKYINKYESKYIMAHITSLIQRYHILFLEVLKSQCD